MLRYQKVSLHITQSEHVAEHASGAIHSEAAIVLTAISSQLLCPPKALKGEMWVKRRKCPPKTGIVRLPDFLVWPLLDPCRRIRHSLPLAFPRERCHP